MKPFRKFNYKTSYRYFVVHPEVHEPHGINIFYVFSSRDLYANSLYRITTGYWTPSMSSNEDDEDEPIMSITVDGRHNDMSLGEVLNEPSTYAEISRERLFDILKHTNLTK